MDNVLLLVYVCVLTGDDKPHLLHTLYYNIKLYSIVDVKGLKNTLPETVLVTSDPDLSVSYEGCVKQV